MFPGLILGLEHPELGTIDFNATVIFVTVDLDVTHVLLGLGHTISSGFNFIKA
jgi:hypothetical protein